VTNGDEYYQLIIHYLSLNNQLSIIFDTRMVNWGQIPIVLASIGQLGSDSNCFGVEFTLKPPEHGGQAGVNFLHPLKTKGTRPPRISPMKPFRWNPAKNETLLKDRQVSFEAMVVAIEAHGLLDVLSHPNPSKYPHQKMLIVAHDGYVLHGATPDSTRQSGLATKRPGRVPIARTTPAH